MSSDRSAIAFERLARSELSAARGEELGWGNQPFAVAPVCDLAELASALARVEALIAAAVNESPGAAAALERIADIAFVLHEREVEPSLCDALDAAMREIGEANARSRARVQRAQEAVALLRALARRLEVMMAAQAQPQSAAHGDELERADEFPAPARLFDAKVAEDGAFAETVAALAESLPERSDAALAQSQDHVAESGAAPDALTHSEVEPEQAEISPSVWMQAENPVSGAEEESAPRMRRAESINTAATPAVDTSSSIDPDEDPGDLFEPTPDMRPEADAAVPPLAVSTSTIQETPPPPSVAPQPPRGAAGAPAYAASRPTANDPLAPIRALSEEELIALFS